MSDETNQSEHPDQVSVERVIPAPPEKIFDLLADPSRHRDIDGSGTVRDAKSGAQRLALGSKFGMSMKLGLPYSMESEVVDFQENRCVAWQSRPPGIFRNLGGGRIWRYDLEPVEGGTRVRETWDISQEKVKALVRPAAGKTRKNMEKTLERIEGIVTNS
ncbi:MAG TPA: SRPBCC family protein [Acidimicrobiia bacterium]|nr:SRPBCC family protein [Acidimicrobiia bacterium]